MVSLNNKKGFTIVELLIVIVVIGILATLVIVTFTGIQQKGRDSQRQTDINAINSHVEAFYAQHGFYPTLASLNSDVWVKANMKGLDQDALRDPKNTSAAMSATAPSATSFHYSYAPLADGGAACGTAVDDPTVDPVTSEETWTDNGCTNYTLNAWLEAGKKLYVKKSS